MKRSGSHLVRDERDREVGAAAKGRAGDAVLAASQLFAAVCLLRGDPAWAAFLSLTFVGGGAQCLHRFWEDRERFFLICGLAASAWDAGICSRTRGQGRPWGGWRPLPC